MMNSQRRRLIGLVAAMSLSGLAHASDFPSRPLTLVVPFAPGGPTDVMARTLADALRVEMGQPVVVDNRAGAGGNIGAELVARAAPDGYTMLFGTSGPLAINQYLFSKMNYAPQTSFAPVIRIGHLPNVLIVNPQVPAKNVSELVAHAKAKPEALSFASSGKGASSHLAGVLFNLRNGTQILHVPYRGTGPALNDLLGGQVSMAFTDVLTAKPLVQAGKLRALGVTTASRSKALPDVPTLQEEGIADMDVSVFFGIVVPTGTPTAVVNQLNAAYVKVLANPEVRSRLSGQGVELPEDTSPAHLAKYMQQESERWRDVIAQGGIQAD